MVIYDISQEITSAAVYPGDPETELKKISDLSRGDEYTLHSLSMSLHTGTHVETPAHFVSNGNTVNQTDLSDFIGPCTVVACNSYGEDLTGADIDELVPAGVTRVLFKTLGRCRLTRSAAFALISLGVRTVGIDAISIASDEDESAVHRELMLAGISIIEGLSLRHVQSGNYTLVALPLKINGAEASPCRAIIIK